MTYLAEIIMGLLMLGFLALAFSALLDSWNTYRLRQLIKSGALGCRCSCPCLNDERASHPHELEGSF